MLFSFLASIIIGVSSGYSNNTTEVSDSYCRAIAASGATPACLPLVKTEKQALDLLSVVQGIVLTGGEDVDPARYGEKPFNSSVSVNSVRDSSDFLILNAAKQLNLPVLGICRGAQLVNVFYGGTLYQDLPAQKASSVQHRQNAPSTSPTHDVKLTEGSRLRFWFGEEVLRVNSHHHQAVKDLAPGFKISAVATDGVIEGFESLNGSYQYVECVQFHPEKLFVGGDKSKLVIFREFVARCANKVKTCVNYEQDEIPDYQTPDPLVFSDGRKVKNKMQWPERRKEILDIFQKEMYGQMPPKPEAVVTEVFDEGVTLNGYAVRKQVRMWFRADKSGPSLNWLIVLPRFAKGPVPSVIELNYRGNQTCLYDKEVAVAQGWMRSHNNGDGSHRSAGNNRGMYLGQENATILPLESIIARGYAFVTACYCDISPDPNRTDGGVEDIQKDLPYTGMFELWGRRDTSRTDNITALGAWAWALSRGLDMIEKENALDASKVVLTGCSRLGKAALIAGAFDERFKVVAPVQTGGGGVPLAKRFYGENVATMTYSFTHWYCKAYEKYAFNERNMPFDQNLFLSCIAPRALLVLGFDNPWFDTEGEWLSVKAASPVWEFLGKQGLPKVDWPADFDTSGIGRDLGYVRRSEEHGISGYDWKWILDFADKQFGK